MLNETEASHLDSLAQLFNRSHRKIKNTFREHEVIAFLLKEESVLFEWQSNSPLPG